MSYKYLVPTYVSIKRRQLHIIWRRPQVNVFNIIISSSSIRNIARFVNKRSRTFIPAVFLLNNRNIIVDIDYRTTQLLVYTFDTLYTIYLRLYNISCVLMIMQIMCTNIFKYVKLPRKLPYLQFIQREPPNLQYLHIIILLLLIVTSSRATYVVCRQNVLPPSPLDGPRLGICTWLWSELFDILL